jgi:hypothetical protein
MKKNRLLISKKEVIKKISLILEQSKGANKKLSLDRLKVFVDNFIKLADFVKQFKLNHIHLTKLIPDQPYNDPDSKEVPLSSPTYNSVLKTLQRVCN